MKYTKEQVQHRAQQALAARRTDFLNWHLLLIALTIRFPWMGTTDVLAKIEALARGETVE